MLVPAMTFEEIRKEIDKDFPIVKRKMGYIADDLNKKLSKAQKQNGHLEYFDYISKYKNHWIIRETITKKSNNFNSLLLYHNGKGHAAIAVACDNFMIYHTGHFFERYNERLNLGLLALNDIMRAYMNETTRFDVKELEEVEPGISKAFCVIKTGVILGINNTNINMLKANTFLRNDQLFEDQKAFSDELNIEMRKQLEKYKYQSASIY